MSRNWVAGSNIISKRGPKDIPLAKATVAAGTLLYRGRKHRQSPKTIRPVTIDIKSPIPQGKRRARPGATPYSGFGGGSRNGGN